MVEALATIGILAVLLGVSVVGVARYRDALKIAELDNAARAIYMAAENRAVLLSSARRMDGLVQKTDAHNRSAAVNKMVMSELEGLSELVKYDEGEERYYVYKAGAGDLLADGSIDPALPENGDFYIVYRLGVGDTGLTGGGSVTDVFYAEKTGDVDAPLEALAGDDFAGFYVKWANSRSARLRLKNDGQNTHRTLVGWHSGESAQGGAFREEQTRAPNPYIDVKILNGERLTVNLTVRDECVGAIDKNAPSNSLTVLLGPDVDDREIFRPVSISLFDKEYTVVEDTDSSYVLRWVLDSLDPDEGQFRDLGLQDSAGAYFALGDDFKVEATIIYGNQSFPRSDTGNSLFWAVTGADGARTASIRNLRHLQNLSDGPGYQSGVSPDITRAVQTANIRGDDNDTYGVDSGEYYHRFIPIVNDALERYDGGGYSIRNLTLRAPESAGPDEDVLVGLFAKVSKMREDGTEKEEMTLTGIRMVNTKVSADTVGTFVGALAGEAGGAAIRNCRVYWETDRYVHSLTARSALGSDAYGVYNYQLKGNTVGGLAGRVSGTVVDHCLAATLICGTANAGGLVGRMEGTGNEVVYSYADCYLTGDGKAAGLVGDLDADADVALTDCYAAGYILYKDTIAFLGDGTPVFSGVQAAAGLCAGSGKTTAENVYSVILYPGRKSGETPDYLTANHERDTVRNTHYLGSGHVPTTVLPAGGTGGTGSEVAGSSRSVMADSAFVETMGSSFKTKGSDESNPYELQMDLSYYIYPGLEELPHYGDWGETLMVPNLVYYEKYVDESGNVSWGIVGPAVSTETGLKSQADLDENGMWVEEDGYAVIAAESGPVTVEYTVRYYDKDGEPAETRSYTDIGAAPMDGALIPVKSQDEFGEWSSREEARLFALPAELVNSDRAGECFYRYIGFELNGDAREFFFNPHFADTVEIYSEGSSVGDMAAGLLAPVEDGTYGFEGEGAVIRTARHLYFLSQFREYYHMGYQFSQELDLDYAAYTGYGSFWGTGAASRTGVQKPIGGGGEDPADAGDAFIGSYNGGNMAIRGLSVNSGSMTIGGQSASGFDYHGLFGYNAGAIRDIVVERGSISGNHYVGGITGYNAANAVVDNCVSRCDVTGAADVGGIAGYNAGGTVNSCANAGRVSSTGAGLDVGGVVGYNTGSGLTGENRNSGTVTGVENVGGVAGYHLDGTVDGARNASGGEVTGVRNVGGAVGYNAGGTVSGCANAGKVSSTGVGMNVGGVVGYNLDGTVDGARNASGGEVTGVGNVGGVVGCNAGSGLTGGNRNSGTVTGVGNVGGVVGYHCGGTVDGAYNTSDGSVSGTDNVGGIVGSNDADGTVTGCGNDNNSLTGTGEDIGGIVGENLGTVTDSRNEKSVGKAGSGANVGGIVGRNLGSVTGCENDTSGGNSVVGRENIGGVVGKNEKNTADGAVGTVLDCGNLGAVGKDIGSGTNVGGIVGYNAAGVGSSAAPNRNTGTVQGMENIGGIVGNNAAGGTLGSAAGGGTEASNENTGDVTGRTSVGGIAGRNGDSEHGVSGELNRAAGVTVSGVTNVGGFVGSNSGKVTDCLRETEQLRVKVCVTDDGGTGEAENNIGGIVGKNEAAGHVLKCWNMVRLDPGDGAVRMGVNVGGIVGWNDGTMGGKDQGNFNSGDVAGRRNVGGVAGKNSATVNGSYNNLGEKDSADSGGDSIVISGDCNVGGYVGVNIGRVEQCHRSWGRVEGGENVGGIVGWNNTEGGKAGAVLNCHNMLALSAGADSINVGGIAGCNNGLLGYEVVDGEIEGGLNTNKVNVSGGTNVGGIAGYNDEKGIIDGQYNLVDKDAQSTTVSGIQNVGGVVGENAGRVENYTTTDETELAAFTVSGKSNVGGFVGRNIGYVRNCTRAIDNSNYITFIIVGGGMNIGGIVGKNDIATDENGRVILDEDGRQIIGMLSQCTNTIPITGSGVNVGGIVGWNSGSLLGRDGPNVNYANVAGKENVGGIVGWNGGGGTVYGIETDEYGVPVENGAYNLIAPDADPITVEGAKNVGGFVGYNFEGGTVKFFTNDKVRVRNTSDAGDAENFGGIVGYNQGTVELCRNTTDIIVSARNVGGVAGTNAGPGSVVIGKDEKNGADMVEQWDKQFDEEHEENRRIKVVRCYNTGDVVSLSDNVGGIVGNSEGSLIANCYNTGAVYGHDYVGGILGRGQDSRDNKEDGIRVSRIEFCYNYGNDGEGNMVFTNVSTDPEAVRRYFAGDDSAAVFEEGTGNWGYLLGGSAVSFVTRGSVGGNAWYSDPASQDKDRELHAVGSGDAADTDTATQILRCFYLGEGNSDSQGPGMRSNYTFYHMGWMAAAMNGGDEGKAADAEPAWTQVRSGIRLIRPVLKFIPEQVGESPEKFTSNMGEDFSIDVFDPSSYSKTHTYILTLDDGVARDGTWTVKCDDVRVFGPGMGISLYVEKTGEKTAALSFRLQKITDGVRVIDNADPVKLKVTYSVEEDVYGRVNYDVEFPVYLVASPELRITGANPGSGNKAATEVQTRAGNSSDRGAAGPDIEVKIVSSSIEDGRLTAQPGAASPSAVDLTGAWPTGSDTEKLKVRYEATRYGYTVTKTEDFTISGVAVTPVSAGTAAVDICSPSAYTTSTTVAALPGAGTGGSWSVRSNDPVIDPTVGGSAAAPTLDIRAKANNAAPGRRLEDISGVKVTVSRISADGKTLYAGDIPVDIAANTRVIFSRKHSGKNDQNYTVNASNLTGWPDALRLFVRNAGESDDIYSIYANTASDLPVLLTTITGSTNIGGVTVAQAEGTVDASPNKWDGRGLIMLEGFSNTRTVYDEDYKYNVTYSWPSPDLESIELTLNYTFTYNGYTVTKTGEIITIYRDNAAAKAAMGIG